jgi:HD-GYP domain-containing protein (c-di-GMP phosphodiesterase class II)
LELRIAEFKNEFTLFQAVVSGDTEVLVMICTDNLVEKLNTLMEFSALINSSLDTSLVRQRAIEAATRLLNADAGSLLLVDQETGELFFEVVTGEKGDKLKEMRLKIGEGLAGWVAQNGEAVIVDNVIEDSRFCSIADRISEYHTHTLLAVPVRVGSRIIGVLQAINKCDGNFTTEDRELLASLAHQVAPAIENAQMYEMMRDTFHGVSMALAEALEKRDYYTGGHTNRVSSYCMAIAGQLGLEEKEMETLWLSSILHDVGKIGVLDNVLQKPGRLDDNEFAIMSMHSQYGSEILSHIKSLRNIVPGVRGHHEQFNGSGYPDKLKAEEIPLIARIISVADAFDAMTSDRPYRRALSRKEAFAELQGNKGRQFDPEIVDAFVAVYSTK